MKKVLALHHKDVKFYKFECITNRNPNIAPQWGKMTGQHLAGWAQ
jgi:hypothetical protein